MNNIDIVMYSLLGGVFPALAWLLFWLREDKVNPEPRIMLLRTFLFGMLAVIAVIPFQKVIHDNFNQSGLEYSLTALVLWATIEEAFKFIAAYLGGLGSREDNEAIDPMIYLITAALGFVALENSLFIARAFVDDSIVGGIVAGNMRFIGPSLLHTVSSATIGVTLALSFYKPTLTRFYWGLFGFLLAIVFHVIFNVAILDQNQMGTFLSFATVWAGITILLLFFEKIKLIKSPIISTGKASPLAERHDTMNT